MNKPLPRAVWVLGVVSLLMDMSSEIIHALLPAFLTVTLALPVAAMGALDGIAEGTANLAKLASGALSDRQQRRKPWIVLGYGMAALSKPLFPLASGVVPVLGARLVDRIGKGIRGAPRDALIADTTPADRRGAAFGLRQAMDTVGAFIAPILAIGLMWLFADDIRHVFWVAIIPALLAVAALVLFLKEPEHPAAMPAAKARWAGFKDLSAPLKQLLAVGFLFGLARFSESFLILKGIEEGLDLRWSPLVLALFNLAYLLLAYPAGALSDRIDPKRLLLLGIGCLVVADLWLARAHGLWPVAIGVVLWGAHMALTQGVFARMIADAATPQTRATSFGAFNFVSGIAAILASLVAGLAWDREGSGATFFLAAIVAALAGAMLALIPVRRGSGTAASGPPHGRA